MKASDLYYGPAVVTGGKYKDRIANIDDDDGNMAICYFGSIWLHHCQIDIPYRNLCPVTTNDLMARKDKISKLIFAYSQNPLDHDKELDLLYELYYIVDILMNRWIESQHIAEAESGKRIFISHSSKDAQIATWISVDLANKGHKPWLDKWKIRVGESIPTEISKGLDECDAIVLLLSPEAIKSGWVEREWQAKYWDEIQSGKTLVLPVLLKDCKIPSLLKMKKFADFREDYNEGMEELSKALLV
jgi:hypothetical protein